MEQLHYTIERFPKGHSYYTEKTITNTDSSKGVIGTFGSVFGQCLDSNGKFMHFTLERKDTLIPEGVYEYTFYYSPLNKCVVPLLKNVPHFNYVEEHIANYAYQLKGCAAHGMGIDLNTPMLQQSGKAFADLMRDMHNKTGTITYKTAKL